MNRGASVAVYPGSFDPVTNGHLDLIQRCLTLFDKVIVAVASNLNKQPLFSLEERLDMLRCATKNYNGTLEVDSFQGLLVHYMRNRNVNVVIRGLRAVSDFEFEFEMALTNRRMAHEVETLFLVPSEEYTFLRASLVKEVARLGGDVSSFVPHMVAQRLSEKFPHIKVI